MAKRNKTIITDGGASIGKNVQTDGGGFVGRDQINFFVSLGDWKKLLEFLSKSNTSNAAQRQWQTFDWSKAEQAYLDKVLKLYDSVRILGNSEDVPLGKLFTQVYILDKPTALYRYDIEELRKQGHDRQDFQRQPGERKQGLDLVKNNQNLFILGKPGAGKTTFLKYITIQAATKQLPRIPIFVSLNQWADSKWGKGNKSALLPFLVEQFDICDFPNAELFIDYILKEGRALVLFDGLDEVKQEKDQRRHLTQLLQAFARKYDQSQHLITCRIAASDYAFTGFTDVEVANFTSEQVREYTQKWFGEQEKKFEAFTTELANPENRGLAELCNTPLLLSLLCLTFDNNMRFPPSRAELYEDALETLLRRWDSRREIQRDEIYRALSHKRKLQLLMSIAVPTFERGELFFRQRDLEKWVVEYIVKLPGAPPEDMLDGTVILKAIEAQHSILVERAQGIYSFSHLTFQEYLTARHLAENQSKEETYILMCRHLTDPRWREVFLLTANLLDNADAHVSTMRRTIDRIVADLPTVLQLLTWAYERNKQRNMPIERKHVVQLAYIFLAHALDLGFALMLVSTSTSALNRTRALDRAHSLHRNAVLILDQMSILTQTLMLVSKDTHYQNFDLANVLAHILALVQILDYTHNLKPYHKKGRLNLLMERSLRVPSHTLTFTFEFARSIAVPISFDYGLCCIWVYATLFASDKLDYTNEYWQTALRQFSSLVDGVYALADKARLANLAQQLVTHVTPLPNASAQEWKQYADSLFVILRDERELRREWNLSDKENDKLSGYLYANELLVQCLKVAAVSDRQVILNELLLPPKSE